MHKSAIHETWMEAIGEELEKPCFKELEALVGREREIHNIYPPPEDVFRSLGTP
jgi:uracil-DNA glycosylase